MEAGVFKRYSDVRSQQLQCSDPVRCDGERRQIVIRIEFIEFVDKFRLIELGHEGESDFKIGLTMYRVQYNECIKTMRHTQWM